MKKPRIEKIDIFVGVFLKKLHLEKKISRLKVAEILCYHVTPQQLEKYETGKNRISIARLQQYL